MKNLNPGIYLKNVDGFKAITELPALTSSSGISPNVDDLASTVGYLYACYRIRSDKLSGLPREIVTESGEPIDEGDIPFKINITDLLWRTELALNLFGQAYWLKKRNRVRVLGVRWLDPRTMSAETDEARGLYAFERRLGANKIHYPVKDDIAPDLVYFWLPGIGEVQPGVALSSVMRRASEVLKSIDIFADKFFDQGAMPVTILVVPPNTRTAEIDRLESRLSRVMHGVRNAFKPIGVRSNVEVKPLGSPPADLAMTDLGESKRDEILAVTGVPISLLTGTAVNYATAQQEARNFIENTIQPRASLIESIINEQLFSSIGLRFHFRIEQLPIMKSDEIAASDALLNLVTSGVELEAAMRILGYRIDELPDDVAATIISSNRLPVIEPGSNGVASDGEDVIAEMRRWRRKARKSIKRNGNAAVTFTSDIIDADEIGDISTALAFANTPEEVDAVFTADFFRGSPGKLPEGYP